MAEGSERYGVLVDDSGRRAVVVRVVAKLALLVCVLYLGLVGISLVTPAGLPILRLAGLGSEPVLPKPSTVTKVPELVPTKRTTPTVPVTTAIATVPPSTSPSTRPAETTASGRTTTTTTPGGTTSVVPTTSHGPTGKTVPADTRPSRTTSPGSKP